MWSLSLVMIRMGMIGEMLTSLRGSLFFDVWPWKVSHFHFRYHLISFLHADIEFFKKEYVSSQEEKADILQAFLDGEGNLDFVYDSVLSFNLTHLVLSLNTSIQKF